MTYTLSIGLAAAVCIGGYFIIKFFRRRKLFNSLRLALLLIKIPKETPSKTTSDDDLKKDVNSFEQLLGNLGALKKPFVFELAVPHIGEEIHFYLAVPRTVQEVAAKQIQGLWNGAVVSPAPEDYTIFNATGATAGAYLLLKESFALPIRTYAEIGADTFGGILGGFAKMNAVGEGAALQIAARPVKEKIKKGIYTQLESLKRGGTFEKILGHGFPFKFKDVQEALNPDEEKKKKEERIIDEDAVKILQAKIAKPLFSVKIINHAIFI